MSEPIPETKYHVVKDDVLETLWSLQAQVTHKSDGSPLGEKCWGFFLGELYIYSKRWNAIAERKAEVARLQRVVDRLKAAIGASMKTQRIDECKAILVDALRLEEEALEQARRDSR